jgi:hypothetical protein
MPRLWVFVHSSSLLSSINGLLFSFLQRLSCRESCSCDSAAQLKRCALSCTPKLHNLHVAGTFVIPDSSFVQMVLQAVISSVETELRRCHPSSPAFVGAIFHFQIFTSQYKYCCKQFADDFTDMHCSTVFYFTGVWFNTSFLCFLSLCRVSLL